MTSIIATMAQEMADEARFQGLSKISYADSAEERQVVWQDIARAGLLAIRDVVGKSVVDGILAPEKEGV